MTREEILAAKPGDKRLIEACAKWMGYEINESNGKIFIQTIKVNGREENLRTYNPTADLNQAWELLECLKCKWGNEFFPDEMEGIGKIMKTGHCYHGSYICLLICQIIALLQEKITNDQD